MTSRLGKPAISLAVLREDATVQALDRSALDRALAKHGVARAELSSGKYSPQHVTQQKEKLQSAFDQTVVPIVARMRARADQARTAVEQWRPDRRRLDAALAAPAEAAAMASRLARVGAEELRRLAADAVARADWLLADAVTVSLARFPLDDTENVALVTEIDQLLGTIDQERAVEAAQHAATIEQSFLTGAFAAADGAGTPMAPTARLDLLRSFPNHETPRAA